MVLKPSQVVSSNPYENKSILSDVILHVCAQIVDSHLVSKVLLGENNVPLEGGVEVY